MPILTIIPKYHQGAELVVFPRKEYEKLLTAHIIPEYQATAHKKSPYARAKKIEPRKISYS